MPVQMHLRHLRPCQWQTVVSTVPEIVMLAELIPVTRICEQDKISLSRIIHNLGLRRIAMRSVFDTFCSRFLDINPVVKLAASAASLMTNIQGSPQTITRHADIGEGGLPSILVIGETAPAAHLITRLIFKHLEQNLDA